MTELPKTFDPAAIEAKWYAHWEASGAFRPHRPKAEPFTIVIPPPNVTGSLHIGHALDNTLQDILIRYHRLKGRDALWVVGTDHAGIATQMVVERQLAAEGIARTDMDREAFVARVWAWKGQSGGQITRQLRRLGASCDWAHERFTMDEGFSAAVTRVFVELYRAGLLYRDKRLVNWDPKLGTAISDLEVETREVAGQLVHFRYPLADGTGHITVATTRPETMLGDTAVAVNPADERYRALVGRMLRHPFDGREIPVIADDWADPAFGSGAVKITPAHDFNDFDVGRRHGLPMRNILDAQARVVAEGAFHGLDRFEARKAVVAALEAAGLLERIEDKTIQMPFGDRSGVVIEPWLTDQWYVNAAELAKAPMAAVRSGETRFVPATWTKTFFQWMENIQPWCVSRQLWWGHRIPAWHAPDGRVFVAETEAQAQAEAGAGVPLTRDPDVLDTWFSSALWPFATLGWPEASERLARHYPGSVLVTGFDIIFFWVARMQMMGHRFMGGPPFRTVYCHGLVRDARGQKMSKSKGNTVDPLGLIDKYGADALRFFMAAMETQGRDIKLSEPRIEGYRNFATKLWNAARFAQGQGIGGSRGPAAPAARLAVNRWIIAETRATAARLDSAMAAFRFDDYAGAIYSHVWDRFCDWYLELIKPLLAEGGAAAEETRSVAGWALDQILVMLHPVMPFITEELWHALAPRPHDLILAAWAEPAAEGETAGEAAAEIDWLIRLVSALRATRSELNVPQGARLPLHVVEASAVTAARLAAHRPALARLARVEEVHHAPPPPGGAAQLVVDEATFALPLAGVIDLAAERARLERAQAQAARDAAALEGRLGNPGFLAKASPEAVEKAREDLAARQAEAARLGAALARLG
jgi:valyl-tRNA synthetase